MGATSAAVRQRARRNDRCPESAALPCHPRNGGCTEGDHCALASTPADLPSLQLPLGVSSVLATQHEARPQVISSATFKLGIRGFTSLLQAVSKGRSPRAWEKALEIRAVMEQRSDLRPNLFTYSVLRLSRSKTDILWHPVTANAVACKHVVMTASPVCRRSYRRWEVSGRRRWRCLLR